MPGVVTRDVLEAAAANDDEAWGYGSRVSKQWRYVSIPAKKVGCSTIKHTLHDLESKPPVEWWETHDGDDEMSMASLGVDEVLLMLNDPGVLKFCFVRNPYDRVFSAWKSKMLSSDDSRYEPVRNAIRDALGYPESLDGAPRPTLAFGDFVRYLAHSGDHRATHDGHWCPQVDAVWWDLITYDVVGRFENFVDDLHAILRRLGAPPEVFERAQIRANASPAIPMSAAYDTELAAIVYDHYRADFDTFGYAEDSWMGCD